MGAVVQLPSRNGFAEQERRRIAAFVAGGGLTVAWFKTECGAVWGCLAQDDDTLGTVARKDGMALWFPRDSVFPFLSHVSLEELLARLGSLLQLPGADDKAG